MCSELWKEIEQLQIKLHDTVLRKGVNSPETIRASKLFREKMDEFQRYKTKSVKQTLFLKE